MSTEHNMAAEEQREVEGSHAILQEIKRGNEALSQKLDQQHFPDPLMIERAHRSPTFRTPGDKRPRPILIRLLKCQDRDKILRMAAKTSREKGGPITFKGEAVTFFPDLSANLVKRRKEYNHVKKELHAKKLQFSLLHPATLRVVLPNGEKKLFKSPEAAASFLRVFPGGD
ncbi:hypothetical protein ABVT39_010314 [Epinephelus coioides]